MMKLLYTLIIILISSLHISAYGDVVTKVSKGKILFTMDKMKKFGIGTVVKVTDGDEEIARAKVIKVGRKLALARLFSTGTPVFKGYEIKIIVFKPPTEKKTFKKAGKTRKKGTPTGVARKFALLAGLGAQTIGAMAGSQSVDPTSFGFYMGGKGELNYRFSQLGVSIGLDYYFGADAVEMPAEAVSSATNFKATGSLSDITLGAQYYLDRFEFHNYYVSVYFMPVAGHKITKEFTDSKFQTVYTGTGLGIGLGKEWIFGKWILQVNGTFKSYSFTSREDNSAEAADSVTIGQTVINGNVLFGYHF